MSVRLHLLARRTHPRSSAHHAMVAIAGGHLWRIRKRCVAHAPTWRYPSFLL